MILKHNKLAKAIFQNYLANRSKMTTATSYATTNYFTCTFYEWGKVGNYGASDYTPPKIFKSRTEFFNFLKESNISYTEEQKNLINSESWCYATCPNKHAVLVITSRYYDLKDLQTQMADRLNGKYLPVLANKG